MRGIVLLALVVAALAAPQKSNEGGADAGAKSNGGDLDALIASVYGNGPQSSSPSPVTQMPSISQNSGAADYCECVPYYQCLNNTISTEGIGLIDIRCGGNNRSAVKGSCDNYLDICCKPPDQLTPDQKVTPKPMTSRGCGQRNPNGVGFRITGQMDNEAQFGEFPWMVAILREEIVAGNPEPLNVYQCGGALIHTRVVLTAAHCVNGKEARQLKIRAGEWDTQTKNELYAHQDREVDSIVVHENFNSGALYNDVALLILKTPVDLAENVDVVCLPPANQNFDGSRCFASGWGKDIFGREGHYQVILKRVELPVVPHDRCQTSLRTTRLGNYFVLNQSFLCAGGEQGRDTCKGDGGSPLVCPLKADPTRYAQVGIVAWGIGCGENQIPGVYANVPYLRQWIDEQMVYNNFDISVYQP